MVRVHEGLPPRPLPLRLPDRPSGPVIAGAPNPAQVVQNVGSAVQSVVQNVLNGLSGPQLGGVRACSSLDTR